MNEAMASRLAIKMAALRLTVNLIENLLENSSRGEEMKRIANHNSYLLLYKKDL